MPSPKRIESVDLSEVTINDDFWNPRLETNRTKTIEYQYKQLQSSGCLGNFRRVAAGKTGDFQGIWFADTDAYKWLEAASYVLTSIDDEDLEARIDEVIELIADAQQDDGYLNSYFILEEPENRWTNLNMMHELYSAGHLFEAAVAHHRATGKDSLLSVAVRFADHIDEKFGNEIDGVPGHQEIELGLIKLARVTGERRYTDLAQYFIELRGRDDRLAWEIEHAADIGGHAYEGRDILQHSHDLFCEDGSYTGDYAQAHAPLEDQKKVEGHAVRAMYFFTGVAELAIETGDRDLVAHLERLWENMVTKRMYVTGGIGSAHEGERFTEDYDLPNQTSYAETCASIGSIFWNQRMFELTGEAKYADLIERTLYNGFLVGVSLNGIEFFYDNVLESDGSHSRQKWFDCACCPPNVARLLASLEQYLYATTDDALYVNQYVGSRATPTFDGTKISVVQTTDYPWEGTVTIDIEVPKPTAFTLNLRVPEWCEDATVEVNDTRVPVDDEEYVTIDRTWDSDTITATFEQSVSAVRTHPAVENNANRIAFTRGPFVYCLEATDNERPLYQYVIAPDSTVETRYRNDLLGGIVTLRTTAFAPVTSEWDGELYRLDTETSDIRTSVTAIPYHVWGNRGRNEMRVWLHTS